jgi:hypothetical protein
VKVLAVEFHQIKVEILKVAILEVDHIVEVDVIGEEVAKDSIKQEPHHMSENPVGKVVGNRTEIGIHLQDD